MCSDKLFFSDTCLIFKAKEQFYIGALFGQTPCKPSIHAGSQCPRVLSFALFGWDSSDKSRTVLV